MTKTNDRVKHWFLCHTHVPLFVPSPQGWFDVMHHISVAMKVFGAHKFEENIENCDSAIQLVNCVPLHTCVHVSYYAMVWVRC